VTNMFYSPDNFSKQCAQGAIANLMNMLQCSKEETDLFWKLANADIEVLEEQLRQQVPKKVISHLIQSKSVYGYSGHNSNLLQQRSSS
jgi:hypothetical protein